MLRSDDILVITNGFWDEPKRMRHKMPLAWAREGNRVLWIEQPPFPPHDWRTGDRLRNGLKGRLVEVAERLWVGSAPPALPGLHKGGAAGSLLRTLHRPWMLRRIRAYMKQLDFHPRLLVLVQQPTRIDLLAGLPHELSVYYSYDLYGHGKADPATLALEQACCRRVDAVFTTSIFMRARLTRANDRTYHIAHAVDPAWWQDNQHVVPPEYADILRPRIVYTGVLQAKMDLDLLRSLAVLRPNLHLVLVGPLAGGQVDAEALARLNALTNVHMLGARDVAALPGYIAQADFLMLPYRLDPRPDAPPDMRARGLALKFFEYFISGRPVLVTPYTDFELSERDLLYVEPDAESWAARIDAVLADPEREQGLAERRIALARQNTYAHRVAQQRAILEEISALRAGD
jgi:glycosyltransferase involved in cell wall biosynthesis